MPATVPISETGIALLSQLSRDSGASMISVLDDALEVYRRHRFLANAAAAYETLAADSAAAADYRREIAEHDATIADGLPHSTS